MEETSTQTTSSLEEQYKDDPFALALIQEWRADGATDEAIAETLNWAY